MTSSTHYHVLGVPASATYNEIKSAYHRLARKHHPDKQQQQQQGKEDILDNATSSCRDSSSLSTMSPPLKSASSTQPPSNIDSNVAGSTTTTYSDSKDDVGVGGGAAFFKFEQIQIAWECLRNEESRRLYDQSLHHNLLLEQRQEQAAISLQLSKDMEEAIDEETGEIAHVYQCRCGDEVQVYESDWDNNKNAVDDDDDEHVNDPSSSSILTDILIECPGCCFVYRIHR